MRIFLLTRPRKIVFICVVSLLLGLAASAFTPVGQRVAAQYLSRQPLAHFTSRPIVLSSAPMFASYTVTKLADTNDGTCDADCSLREAIAAAQANAGADTITFAPAVTGTITLSQGQLSVDSNLTIQGPGADVLAISGNDALGVFVTGANNTSAIMAISGLTITKGLSGNGGGINNFGTLTVTDCAIIDNRSSGNGGGIQNGGTMTIERSTIRGNSSSFDAGGILNFADAVLPGKLTLTNCTITENSAPASTGGIYNNNFGNPNPSLVTIVNCTIANNSGSNGAGIRTTTGGGPATTVLKNTILANNTPENINTGGVGVTVTSQGNNLVSDGGNGFLNQASDKVNTNPLLAALANYGGPTQTYALLPGSPALDAGDNAAASALALDQRGAGFPRVVNGVVDMGALESPVLAAALPCKLDMDGDNQVRANKEGLVLLRSMLGFSGAAVVNGTGISLGQWDSVRNNLNTNCGTSFAP